MDKKFKIGDTVVLKSGSPEMTISKEIKDKIDVYTPNTFMGNFEAKWFDGTKVYSDIFHQDSLDFSR